MGFEALGELVIIERTWQFPLQSIPKGVGVCAEEWAVIGCQFARLFLVQI